LNPIIAKSVAAELTQRAEGLIKAVFGPPAEEIGQLLKEKVSFRRYRNLLKIAAKAKDMLEAAGLSPKEVPLSIIHPLLESASLEEDEGLQARWAALLANVSVLESPSLRCFTEILKQLSPLEARFLDKAHDEAFQPRPWGPPNMAPPKKYPILENTLSPLSTPMIVNVERLGLVTRLKHDHAEFTSSWGMNAFAVSNHLWMSDFGLEFVRACRPPGKAPQSIT
jgi:hypothetical protein